jgi:hypothetical protein
MMTFGGRPEDRDSEATQESRTAKTAARKSL